jgi:hypothetical protein
MTSAPSLLALADPVPGGQTWVLPEAVCQGMASRGPRFSDDVWDFRDIFPRTVASARIDFTKITSPVLRLAVREFLYSRLHHVALVRRSAGTHRPVKATGLHREYTDARMWVTALEDLGVTRLADARQQHLDAIAARWAAMLLPSSLTVRISLIQAMAAHSPYLSGDRLTFMPWQGRAPAQVARHHYSEENTTPRIPEPIMARMLEAALFYVQTASADLLAARDELARLRAARAARSRLPSGQARARIEAFISTRRGQGRGIPALPAKMARLRPDAPVAGGVVQAPNAELAELLAGTGGVPHLRGLLDDAGAELGYEEGGLDTGMSAWPRTGRPWRPRLDPASLPAELSYLRTASWITIAYLSGMRDTEVRELSRDCAFTTTGADCRTRYKLRGRVFKGRQLSGDHAEWVVLQPVHQAVDVLRQLNDDPGHLFGYAHGSRDYLTSAITTRLAAFRDHASGLFADGGEPFIPHDGDQPWAFSSRQFRRTLAWHIAHQPFGVIAGARQYHHAKLVMFEGYAGTSASGFAAEVAAEENIATLDYLEDLYRDWDAGARSDGGAAARIDAEFGLIRADLGDLPGIIADPSRLRAMLTHLTKTLHPGVLNDCFFNPATAACARHAGHTRQPLPMLNTCLRCPNARRSSIHLPRLAAARDQAAELRAACEAAGPVPAPQHAAITGYISDLTQLIDQITTTPADQEGQR